VTVADGDVGSTLREGKRGGVQRPTTQILPAAETTCWGMNGPGRAAARTVVVAAP
jgi:hypothetical protein